MMDLAITIVVVLAVIGLGIWLFDEDDTLTATNSRLFTFEWRDR